jgi:hypothetical protein
VLTRFKVLRNAVADAGTSNDFGLRLRHERGPHASASENVLKPVLCRGTSPLSVRPYIQMGHSQSLKSRLARTGSFVLWTRQALMCLR